MLRFLIKVLVLIGVLFIGILIGFQEANSGLNRLKGSTNYSSFQKVVSIGENDNGDYETVVIGNRVSSHNLDEKKKVLEKMNTYNFFTDVAKKLSTLISSIFSGFFSMFSSPN